MWNFQSDRFIRNIENVFRRMLKSFELKSEWMEVPLVVKFRCQASLDERGLFLFWYNFTSKTIGQGDCITTSVKMFQILGYFMWSVSLLLAKWGFYSANCLSYFVLILLQFCFVTPSFDRNHSVACIECEKDYTDPNASKYFRHCKSNVFCAYCSDTLKTHIKKKPTQIY